MTAPYIGLPGKENEEEEKIPSRRLPEEGSPGKPVFLLDSKEART